MIVGSTFGMWFANRFGRKKSLIMCGVILFIFPILLAVIVNYWAVFVIRIILGFAIGLSTCVGPMYVTETVESKYRGRLGSMYPLILIFGMTLAYLANYVFAKGVYDENIPFDKWQWSVQYVIGALIGLGLLVTLIWTKESQVWLNSKKLEKETKNQTKTNITVKPINIRLTFKQKLGYYSLAVMLGVLAQFCGANAVVFYSNSILNKAGMSNPLLSVFLIIGCWNFVCVCLEMYIVGKCKRRTMMICGTFGLTIGNLLMGISLQYDITVLAIIGLILYLITYECSIGSLFYLLSSEIFPREISTSGLSIAVSTSNAGNILVSFLFPVVEKEIGSGPCFFIFTGFTFLCTIGCYFFLPESSGDVIQLKSDPASPLSDTQLSPTSDIEITQKEVEMTNQEVKIETPIQIDSVKSVQSSGGNVKEEEIQQPVETDKPEK